MFWAVNVKMKNAVLFTQIEMLYINQNSSVERVEFNRFVICLLKQKAFRILCFFQWSQLIQRIGNLRKWINPAAQKKIFFRDCIHKLKKMYLKSLLKCQYPLITTSDRLPSLTKIIKKNDILKLKPKFFCLPLAMLRLGQKMSNSVC